MYYIPIRASISAFQSIAFEYAAEMTYPVPEGISGGLMNWLTQVLQCDLLYSQVYLSFALLTIIMS